MSLIAPQWQAFSGRQVWFRLVRDSGWLCPTSEIINCWPMVQFSPLWPCALKRLIAQVKVAKLIGFDKRFRSRQRPSAPRRAQPSPARRAPGRISHAAIQHYWRTAEPVESSWACHAAAADRRGLTCAGAAGKPETPSPHLASRMKCSGTTTCWGWQVRAHIGCFWWR